MLQRVSQTPTGSRILIGDCIESMRALPDQSVNCCVTSPPYFGLRDYGVDGQIGLEKTPEEYVAKMVNVFREVRRVLRDDATLWLNLGDSYATGRFQPERVGTPAGYKTKDLLGMPWRVAFALQADGWYLRQDIIWHKPNPMPESVRDRCTKAHEYIFMLAKSPKYFYDHRAMQEPCVKGAAGSEFHTGKTGEHQLGRSSTKPRKNESLGKRTVTGFQDRWDSAHGETRNRRDVWTVASQPFKEAHFATFPPALIEPCVLAGCPVGGVVLDCFGGSGTVGMVAAKHGRKYILCELNPEYGKMSERRIAGRKV